MSSPTSTDRLSGVESPGGVGSRSSWAVASALAVAVGVVAYVAAPAGASPIFIWACLAVFYSVCVLVVIRPVLILREVPTFASLEVFFLVFYYLLFYRPYQEYVLGLGGLKYSSILHHDLFVDYSNQAVLLATLGFVGFMTGMWWRRDTPSHYWSREEVRQRSASNPESQWFPLLSTSIQIALMGTYLLAGWRTAGEGRYTDSISGGSAAEGVTVLIVIFCFTSIANYVCYRLTRIGNWAFVYSGVVATVLWAIRVIFLGDRNTFLLIVIAAMAGVAGLLIRGRRITLAACAFCALALYNAVEVVRDHGVSFDALLAAFVGGGAERYAAGIDTSSFNITTVTLRASVAAVPGSYDYAYGWYKLVGVLGIVPFVRGAVIGDDPAYATSSYILTRLLVGANEGWSVGTNVLSDIQMDFGVLAVPFIMACVGLFAGRVRRNVIMTPWSNSRVAIYLAAVAHFAELPRYALDFPVRFLVWMWVILALFRAIARTLGGRADAST